MPVARDIASVIAGEATYGTQQERWNDMVNIASTMVNRANQLGVSLDSVVSAKGQYSAYGRALPPGVDSNIVGMAQEALDFVKTNGPTTSATYYATPDYVDKLPDGLAYEAQTTGHQFFSDPNNQPVRTAEGVITPTIETPSYLSNTEGLTTPVDQAEVAKPTTPGTIAGYLSEKGLVPSVESIFAPAKNAVSGILSLANQEQPAVEVSPSVVSNPAPEDNGVLGAAPMANIDLSTLGQNRPYSPDQRVLDAVQTGVTDTLGPGYSINVTSGTEGGLAQFGSNRHKTGLAADITITDPDGNKLSWNDPNEVGRLQDVAQALAAQNQANIGLGYKNSPNMMHVDLVDPENFTPGQDSEWGVIGNQMADTLAEARATGLMPSSYYDKWATRAIDTGVVPSAAPTEMREQPQIADAFGVMGVIDNITPGAVTNGGILSAPSALPTNQAAQSSLGQGILASRADLGIPSQEVAARSALPSYAAAMQAADPVAAINASVAAPNGILSQPPSISIDPVASINATAAANPMQGILSGVPSIPAPTQIAAADPTGMGTANIQKSGFTPSGYPSTQNFDEARFGAPTQIEVASNDPASAFSAAMPSTISGLSGPGVSRAMNEAIDNAAKQAANAPMMSQALSPSLPSMSGQTAIPSLANTYSLNPSLQKDQAAQAIQGMQVAQPTEQFTPGSMQVQGAMNAVNDIMAQKMAAAAQTPAFNQAVNPTMPSLQTAGLLPSVAPVSAPVTPGGILSSVSPEVQQAMQAPNFNQALNPTISKMSMQAVPNFAAPALSAPVDIKSYEVASVPGPATNEVDPAATQQQQQIQRAASIPTPTARPAPQKQGLLSGLLSKETLAGGALGVLGGATLGPVGGILGAILGQQLAKNGGIGGLFNGGTPATVTSMAPGSQSVYSVYGGGTAPGSQAMTNNGGRVTSLPGGAVAYTNSLGATTITSPEGQSMADWSGNSYTPGSTL